MLMTAQNLPSQNVSASLHHMLSTGVSIHCHFQAQHPHSESVTKSRLAGSEKPQFPMAQDQATRDIEDGGGPTGLSDRLQLEVAQKPYSRSSGSECLQEGAVSPGSQGLLMKLMEVSLVLKKLVIKQALECYDDAGLFSAGAKMEKSEFLDFQSYGFKVLLMEVRKKASRCTVESSRQPGYIKELIEGYRKQDAKNKKPGKQEQTSSPSKKRSWFISVKVGSPGSSDGYITPQNKRKFDELSDVSPKAKSSCKKTKVALSEMKPMKTTKPSVMKKAWHKRAMGS